MCWIFSFLCTLSLFHLPSPLSIILLSIVLFLMTPHLFPASLYLPDTFPLFMTLYILLSISSAGLFSSKLSIKGYLISYTFSTQSPFLPSILFSNKNKHLFEHHLFNFSSSFLPCCSRWPFPTIYFYSSLCLYEYVSIKPLYSKIKVVFA